MKSKRQFIFPIILGLLFCAKLAYASTDLGGNPPVSDPNSPTFTAYVTYTAHASPSGNQWSVKSFLYSAVLTPTGSCDVSNFGACTFVSLSSLGYVGLASDVTNANGQGNTRMYPILKDPVNGVRQYGDCSSVFVCQSSFGLDTSPVTVDGRYQNQAGLYSGGSLPFGPLTDTSTRIISFTPENGTTTPLNVPVAFNGHVFINPNDIGRILTIKVIYRNQDQNTLLFSTSPYTFNIFSGNATTSGDLYFATSTLLAKGNYKVEMSLDTSTTFGAINLGLFPGTIHKVAVHQFIVGSSTFIGNISQNLQDIVDRTLAVSTSTGTSTAAVGRVCSPITNDISTLFLNTNFSVTECLAFMFIPDSGSVSDSLTSFKEELSTKVPWGYVTRLYVIFSGAATTSLPTISYTFDPNGPLSGQTFNFDPGDMIAGGGTLLNSVQDPLNHRTIRDVLEPLVKLLIALGVVLTIVTDITKSHDHNSVAQHSGNKQT